MSGVLVQRHRSFEDIPGMEWEELRAKTPSTSIFQSYGWNVCWWRCKGSSRGILALHSARVEGRLVGIAPLYLETQARFPMLDRPELSFIGSGNADYCDFIVDEEHAQAAAELLRCVVRIPERWAVLRLGDLPDRSAVLRALRSGRHRNLESPKRSTACPAVLRVPGERTFEKLTQKKMLRQNTKLLSRAGRVETMHLTGAETIQPHLDGFFSQHIRRWKPTPHPSLFLQEGNRSLYRCVVDQLAPEGKILFSVVTLDGAPVAYHFGFLEGTTLYYYKPSYDPAFAKLSPGSTLLSSLFQFCENRDLTKFDFMRGDEAYKAQYANHNDPTWTYSIHRGRGRLFASLATRWLKGTARRLVRAW
jgi:CelD/BcsL family acetyltransferase involved in cellulose biosynthesis